MRLNKESTWRDLLQEAQQASVHQVLLCYVNHHHLRTTSCLEL